MRNKKNVYLAISIVSLLIVVIALAAIGVLLLSYKQSSDDYSQLAQEARTEPTTVQAVATEATEEPEPTVPLAEIPINFEYLREENEDIIGWITVLGTIIGVVVFKGVAAGPVIASGMTYLVITLFNLHF